MSAATATTSAIAGISSHSVAEPAAESSTARVIQPAPTSPGGRRTARPTARNPPSTVMVPTKAVAATQAGRSTHQRVGSAAASRLAAVRTERGPLGSPRSASTVSACVSSSAIGDLPHHRRLQLAARPPSSLASRRLGAIQHPPNLGVAIPLDLRQVEDAPLRRGQAHQLGKVRWVLVTGWPYGRSQASQRSPGPGEIPSLVGREVQHGSSHICPRLIQLGESVTAQYPGDGLLKQIIWVLLDGGYHGGEATEWAVELLEEFGLLSELRNVGYSHSGPLAVSHIETPQAVLSCQKGEAPSTSTSIVRPRGCGHKRLHPSSRRTLRERRESDLPTCRRGC